MITSAKLYYANFGLGKGKEVNFDSIWRSLPAVGKKSKITSLQSGGVGEQYIFADGDPNFAYKERIKLRADTSGSKIKKIL